MRKTQLSIVIETDKVDTIDIIAKYHDTSRSAMIDELIRRGLKRLTLLETQALDAERIRRRKEVK